jgi:hypothetical protein
MIKAFYIFLFALASYPLHAMNEQNPGPTHSHIISNTVKEVEPGVYAGQARVGNEIVYFGMEKVDEHNKKFWDIYKNKTRYLTQEGRGIFSSWAKAIHDGHQQFPYSEEIAQRTGFSEKEYTDFWNKLAHAVKSSRVVKGPHSTALSIINAFDGIPSGIAGFQIDTSGNFYVLYASRKPVTGHFPFPQELPDFINLKQYYEYFENIIMIVRSDIESGKSSYDNRGIFKNPISFIEDGNKYPGLSMKLHAFSAVVAHLISKGILELSVSPVASMRAIIMKTKGWQKGDVIVNGKDILDFTPEEKEKFESSEQMEEPNFRIKVEALIRMFEGG